VAREVIGAEEIVDYTVRENFLQRLTERFGAALGRSLASEATFGRHRDCVGGWLWC